VHDVINNNDDDDDFEWKLVEIPYVNVLLVET
jgi:hypothetical protein